MKMNGLNVLYEDEWFECNYMKMNGLNVTIWRWMVWM